MKSLPLIISLLLFAIACSEPNDPSPMAVFDETLLTNENGWSLTSEIKDNGTVKTDLSLSYPTCVRDDHFKFQANHTYAVEEGTSKCQPNDPTVKISGTWKLNSGVLTLVPSSTVAQPFTFSTASTSFTITRLTATDFVYSYLEIAANGSVASTTTASMKPVSLQ